MDPTKPGFEGEAAPVVGPGTRASGGPGRRLGVAAAVAGLVAGLASWGIGDGALIGFKPAFHMSDELRQRIETSTAEVRRQMEEATTRTAAVSYGAMAGLLGLGLGVAGGIGGRSAARGLAGAAVGLVVGLVVGGCSSYLMAEVFRSWFRASSDSFSKDLTRPLMLHAGMWLPAGLAGGLALGIGFEGWRRGLQAAFGGVLGAVVAVAAIEIVGALAFATAKTTHPIATQAGARLLVHLTVALLVAGVSAWSMGNLRMSRSRRDFGG